MRNGNSVVVRVNDRGPFIRGRVLDLSRGAANSLHMIATRHGESLLRSPWLIRFSLLLRRFVVNEAMKVP